MLGAEHDSEKTGKTAKTRVRAKPDGLTPLALQAKRPLIAPSRPSSSRLGPLSSLLGAGKWGAGGRTTVRPALAPHLSCKRCVFAAIFSGHCLCRAGFGRPRCMCRGMRRQNRLFYAKRRRSPPPPRHPPLRRRPRIRALRPLFFPSLRPPPEPFLSRRSYSEGIAFSKIHNAVSVARLWIVGKACCHFASEFVGD